MTRPFTLASKTFAAVGVLTLVAAACSSNKTAAPPTSSPSASASPSEQAMPLPPGSEKMRVKIDSPASGLRLTANQLPIRVSFAGFTPSCDWAGKDNKNGIGHYHVLLDKSLINMFCKPTATISMQNVKPGMHELAVAPTLNDHAEVLDNEEKIEFDYEPTSPLKPITAESTTAKPAIEILSPADGSTLRGPFTLKVRITNFEDECNLLGKPDVAGYGHWHVNVDSMTGPMMGMMTMLGMACTNTFTGTTVGLTPGKHTIFALLTDNGHAPLEIFDKIDVTVG